MVFLDLALSQHFVEAKIYKLMSYNFDLDFWLNVVVIIICCPSFHLMIIDFIELLISETFFGKTKYIGILLKFILRPSWSMLASSSCPK